MKINKNQFVRLNKLKDLSKINGECGKVNLSKWANTTFILGTV